MSWLPGGHTLPTALSWAVAVVVAVLLLIVVFKFARRIVHRLTGIAISLAITTLLRAQLSPLLHSWLGR